MSKLSLVLYDSDRTLSVATTPSLSVPGSDGNEGVLYITGISPSDCLVSNSGHSLGGYPSAEKQLVYSAAPANWAIQYWSIAIKYSLVSHSEHLF